MNSTRLVLNQRILSATSVLCVACLFLAIAKIFLVSQEEIIARDLPHDDLWHIMAAARGYWFGDNYTNMTFIHLPIYSLWVALVYFTGVPLRVATEVLFLLSGSLFVLSLSRAGINTAVCTVAYGLIIFHPVSFQLFNYNLAETLYAPLLILLLAGIVMTWISRGQRACCIYSISTGIVSSLIWNLRKENLLILGLFIFFGFIAFIALCQDGYSNKRIAKQLGIMIFLPVAVITIVSLAVKTINYKKFGLFVSTEMSAPGYTAAYKALLRIKPPNPIRFIPVTTEVRKAAYVVSPAFKELEPFLESESGFGRFETEKYMGIKGEIAAGWFYWVLRDAAALAGHHTSALDADAYYQKVADEINNAIDSGRLPGRFVLMTFLDPETKNYLPYLPDSLHKMWKLFTISLQPLREDEAVNINPEIRKFFDTVVNRRAALTDYNISYVQGWVFSENDSIKRVLLRSASGRVLGACENLTERPDVVDSFNAKGEKNIPVQSGFTVSAVHVGQQLVDAQLVFINSDDKEFSVPYKEIISGKVYQALPLSTNHNIRYGLDSRSLPNVLKIRNSLQILIWSMYGKLVTYLSFFAILAGMIIVLSYRSINSKENISVILSLMLFVVFTRIALFALLDASSWPGNQARYLFPVMPIYSCFLLVFINKAFCILITRVKP